MKTVAPYSLEALSKYLMVSPGLVVLPVSCLTCMYNLHIRKFMYSMKIYNVHCTEYEYKQL